MPRVARLLALLCSVLIVECGSEPASKDAALCASATPSGEAGSVIAYGLQQLASSMPSEVERARVHVVTVDDPSAAGALAAAGVDLDPRPESYVLVPSGDETFVVGRDGTGAMYGALDLAERLKIQGASALPLPKAVSATPSVSIRGANVFAVLPDEGESCWWFRDAGYWREYLDLLARARMNFLDLHAMYNLKNTIFPNALLYFAESASHPEIGAPPSERAANLAMLNTIVEMARVRGIRVGLMSYRSDLSLSGGDRVPVPDDPRLQVYTREAAEFLARHAPGLWRLGFRIGESSHDAGWYNGTFVAGVAASGTDVQISTRTWLTTKDEVLGIVAASPRDVLVQAKYNGEQLGPPYVVTGGAAFEQRWRPSYFYEDYLQEPAPYTFIFQVWASGTHRFFRQASYARTKRIAETLLASPHVKGFTLQPSHAYFPQRDYYHRDPADRFSPWTFRRDELEYLLFGRLTFDPATPESTFRAALEARVGKNALWDAVQAASEIVPWIQTAHGCGADSREFAAELEWTGTTRYWASSPSQSPVSGSCAGYHGPFDSFSVASPFDAARDLVTGSGTTRVSPLDVARFLLGDAHRARALASSMVPSSVEARDVARECLALADLGEYAAHKLRGATALAVYSRTGAADYEIVAREETELADAAWRALGNDTAYVAPFVERLRMGYLGYSESDRGETTGYPKFHWSEELAAIESSDLASIDAAVADYAGRVHANAAEKDPPASLRGPLPPAARWLDDERPRGPGPVTFRITPPDPQASQWSVALDFAIAPPPGAVLSLLTKPYATASDWNATPVTGSGTHYEATVKGTGAGALFAVEVGNGAERGWRYPDPLVEAPYRALAPR